jgi:aminoglycoside phosphotransferase (APT) family kinase protein
LLDPRKVILEFGLPPGPINIELVSGGFSGALVWKVSVQNESYALKAWPRGQPACLALNEIHQRMEQARSAGLMFVPRLIKSKQGTTIIRHSPDEVELSTWQQGQAETQAPCSVERLRAAVQAISQVHSVWRASTMTKGVCVGVQRQWQRLTEWTSSELDRIRSSVQGRSETYRIGFFLLMEQREEAMKNLTPWLNRKVMLHYCLGDVWSAHLLFTGNEVTGLIDYGGMRLDHPAQDLARLLGSLCQGQALLRQVGLDAYPGPEELKELAVILGKTGAIVGIGNWLRWLVLEERQFADPALAEKRFTQLVDQQSRN